MKSGGFYGYKIQMFFRPIHSTESFVSLAVARSPMKEATEKGKYHVVAMRSKEQKFLTFSAQRWMGAEGV